MNGDTFTNVILERTTDGMIIEAKNSIFGIDCCAMARAKQEWRTADDSAAPIAGCSPIYSRSAEFHCIRGPRRVLP
jgi:hypothetical protein